MASQITRNSTVCSPIRLIAKKQQSTTLQAFREGNRPVTGGFPSQRASNGVILLNDGIFDLRPHDMGNPKGKFTFWSPNQQAIFCRRHSQIMLLASMQQAIIYFNADRDLRHHMASLGVNGLTIPDLLPTFPVWTCLLVNIENRITVSDIELCRARSCFPRLKPYTNQKYCLNCMDWYKNCQPNV